MGVSAMGEMGDYDKRGAVTVYHSLLSRFYTLLNPNRRTAR
jgi:hypothetical protein